MMSRQRQILLSVISTGFVMKVVSVAEFFSPMLAKSATRQSLETGNWDNYIAEPKHDGMRAVVVKNHESDVRVFGRSGKEYTEHVPHLVEEFCEILPSGTILDGELAMIPRGSVIKSSRMGVVPVVDFNKTF